MRERFASTTRRGRYHGILETVVRVDVDLDHRLKDSLRSLRMQPGDMGAPGPAAAEPPDSATAEPAGSAPAATTSPWSVRRINALAAGMDARSYVEIGVWRGDTFRHVTVPHRIGVDPAFAFDVSTISDAQTRLLRQTSDEFFASLSADRTFDLFFLDGLHTFEQTYRDVCNALLHSHSRTILLIDDTRPNDVYSTMRDGNKAIEHRRAAGNPDLSWHGDVFKTVFALHDFHPGLDYRTIVGSGNPQTIVWRAADQRQPRFESFEAISRLSYFEMVDAEDVLRSCDEQAAIAAVRTAMHAR
jgi:hypothetical protein